MRTSVIICVYTEERWEDIKQAVGSVERQTRPPHELILVVDHNPGLQRRLEEAYPQARVVANAHEKGLSGGKNTGVEVATGDLVAFLDDDAVADPGWLEALEEGFQEPDVVGVGGRTEPVWASGRRPRWFPPEFDWTVGCTYRGIPLVKAPIRNVMGGNAAFVRKAVAEVGGFHSGIGRSVQGRKSRPLGCEETEFCIRLAQRKPGSVMLYQPAAVIGHKVSRQRESVGYFLSRCFAEGLSKALVTREVGAAQGLASERAHAMKTLPLGVLRSLGEALRGDVGGLGRALAIVAGLAWTTWGYVLGSWRVRSRS
ncbi:glycosyltransferase family 2 protein [Thermoactinospora rubra]|uniref:glycosyltransferase family 2 protein n=1 Tax=Thermoactinospora rubra TaxID=1088767 RepID=UPI000A0F8346|nr:glycosyltransferase family 2 protein [Thermoactinospora rubra]